MLTTYSGIGLVSAQVQFTGIHYRAIYDPLENEGLLEVVVTMNSEEPSWLSMPVNIFGETVQLRFQNYSYTGDIVLGGVNYAEDQDLVEALTYGRGALELYFTIRDLTVEASIGVFEIYVDTTILAPLTRNVTVEIVIPGKYELESTTILGETRLSVSKEQKSTKLYITGIGEHVVTLYTYLEEQGPAAQYWPTGLTYIAIAITVGSASTLLAYYVLRRKKVSVIVERVDYADNVTRAILKALKEAGDRGLVQSEIVRITGLPKSSVSRRIRRLEEEGFIEVKRAGKYNVIHLTSKGLELSKKLLDKGG
ncbi:MAG: winged helix-turn-helix transcriptional regulator [Desulfurococcaceae archaeon]